MLPAIKTGSVRPPDLISLSRPIRMSTEPTWPVFVPGDQEVLDGDLYHGSDQLEEKRCRLIADDFIGTHIEALVHVFQARRITNRVALAPVYPRQLEDFRSAGSTPASPNARCSALAPMVLGWSSSPAMQT